MAAGGVSGPVTLTVVGAGLGRTGTHSLKLALERLLGGRCHHMIEVFGDEDERAVWTQACLGEAVDFGALLSAYRACTDMPGCFFWPELLAANPDALVLLSVRESPEVWHRSAANTILPSIRMASSGGDPWMTAMVQMLGERFSDQLEDRDAMLSAYERHNDAVRAGVPRGPAARVAARRRLGADLRPARPSGARRALPQDEQHRRLPGHGRVPAAGAVSGESDRPGRHASSRVSPPTQRS